MKKNVLVIGASLKSNRFSYLAVKQLRQFGHQVVAVGKKQGNIFGVDILTDFDFDLPIDTVTIYLNPTNQSDVIESVFKLNPKRIIFNPGTENAVFIAQAKEKGINVTIDCTLVMLNTATF